MLIGRFSRRAKEIGLHVNDSSEHSWERWVCIPQSVSQAVTKYVSCDCYYAGVTSPWLRGLVTDDTSWPNQLSTGFILANMLAMMLQSHDQSDAQANALTTANVVFTVFFTVEMVLKLIIVGPGDLFEWGDGFVNMIDAAVVAISLVELMYDGSGTLTSFRLIRLMKLLKVLRAGKIARRFKSFTKVSKFIETSMAAIWPFLFLLGLIIFMFAALGMQLFPRNALRDRVTFKNFGVAVVQVVLILFGEEWGAVYEELNDKAGGVAFLFCISLIIVGQ